MLTPKRLASLVILFGVAATYVFAQGIYGPTRGGGGGGGGGAIEVPQQTVIYVAPNGNDGTAEVGNPQKPYLTPKVAFAVPSNNCLIFLLPGSYSLTPSLLAAPLTEDLTTETAAHLLRRTNVTVRAYGATLTGNGQGNLLNICECEDLRIEGLTFDGDWPTLTADHGDTPFAHAYFVGTNLNVAFKDCKFTDFGDTGLGSPYSKLNGTVLATTLNQNILVDGCRFYRGGATNSSNGFEGAGVAPYAAGLTVRNSTFERLKCTGVNITGHISSKSAQIVENNQFGDVEETGVLAYAAAGLTTNDYTGFVIQGNSFKNVSQNVAGLTGTSSGLHQAAIMLAYCKGAIIANNTIDGAMAAIKLAPLTITPHVTQFLIANNVINNTTKISIETLVDDTTPITLYGGHIHNNLIQDGAGYAMSIEGHNLDIRNNRMLGNGWNTATYGSSGVTTFVNVHATATNLFKVTFEDNYFGDSQTNSAHNIAITYPAKGRDCRIVNNKVNARLAAITTQVSFLGTGQLLHPYTASTAASSGNTDWFTYATPANCRVIARVRGLTGPYNSGDFSAAYDREYTISRNAGSAVNHGTSASLLAEPAAHASSIDCNNTQSGANLIWRLTNNTIYDINWSLMLGIDIVF